MKSRPAIMLAALLLTAVVFAAGYYSFGFQTTLIFMVGYLGGFAGWLLTPNVAPFAAIKVPYLVTFLLFLLLHRVEEYVSGFQRELSKITGVPIPEVDSLALVVLLTVSIGVWLLAPLLVWRAHPLGYYLAWTFFCSMGVGELAHFVLALFRPEPYGYFPGMASVFLLAPAAWFGMWRLSRKDRIGVVQRS